MNEHRLMERISGWEDGLQRTNQQRADVLIHSVMGHLRRILNTRQGSVSLDPMFGVPDFTNFAGGLANGETRDIENQICMVVASYEPRIRNPRVVLMREESDLMSLHFQLEGMLQIDQEEIPLRLCTIVGANGRIQVA